MNISVYSRQSLSVAVLVLLGLLSACGGGGGGTPPAVASAQTDVQGMWRGQSVVTAGTYPASALVLPDGESWVVISDASWGTVLAHGQLSLNSTADGFSGATKAYDMSTGLLLTTGTWTGTADAQVLLSVLGSDVANLGKLTLDQFRSQAFDSSLSMSGSWQNDAATPTLQWVVDGQGALSGTGTGCSYAGTVAQHAQVVSVAEVSLTETCGAQTVVFQGVATAGSDAATRMFTLVSADDSKAIMVNMSATP